MYRRSWPVLVAAACGRFNFEAQPDASATDATNDAVSSDATRVAANRAFIPAAVYPATFGVVTAADAIWTQSGAGQAGSGAIPSVITAEFDDGGFEFTCDQSRLVVCFRGVSQGCAHSVGPMSASRVSSASSSRG